MDAQYANARHDHDVTTTPEYAELRTRLADLTTTTTEFAEAARLSDGYATARRYCERSMSREDVGYVIPDNFLDDSVFSWSSYSTRLIQFFWRFTCKLWHSV